MSLSKALPLTKNDPFFGRCAHQNLTHARAIQSIWIRTKDRRTLSSTPQACCYLLSFLPPARCGGADRAYPPAFGGRQAKAFLVS